MQRSNSITHLDDSENFIHFSGSGADLSRYQEQLARERNSRTLNLRHMNRISITGILQNTGHQSIGARTFTDPNNSPFLNPSIVIDAIKSNNIQQVTQYVQNISSFAARSPKRLNSLITEEFFEFIIENISKIQSDEMLVQIISVLGALFPHCGLLQERISEGLFDSNCFSDMLESASTDVILSLIELISTMSTSSSNARDTFISFGIYSNLIDIANKEASIELSRTACKALCSIFSNSEPINDEDTDDENFLIDIVPSLSKLLSLNDKESVSYIIDCFVEMTNKYNQLNITLFDCGIYPLSVEMLKDEELIGPTLRLVGNLLVVAEQSKVKVLIDSGLLPILNNLLRSEYASKSFWVLSNLIEKTPDEIIPYCDSDFIQEVIDIISLSSFDIQKEGSYFLCLLICLTPSDNVTDFMDQTIIDLLNQMINCGIDTVIDKCLDALVKLLKYTQCNLDSSAEFFTSLIDSDLKDNLDELMEQDSKNIVEKVTYVTSLLEEIEQELNSS